VVVIFPTQTFGLAGFVAGGVFLSAAGGVFLTTGWASDRGAVTIIAPIISIKIAV